MTVLCGLPETGADELVAAAGPEVAVLAGLAEVSALLDRDPDQDLVVIGPAADLQQALAFADRQRIDRPLLGVLLVRAEVDVELLTLALRSGVREVVRADDVAGLGAACRRSHALFRAAAVRPADGEGGAAAAATLITVFSTKGGCGKTTTATNLAVALADNGARRVCLLDLDLSFGDVAITLQLSPDRTIADAIPLAGNVDADAARGLLTTWGAGLDCLLAPVAPGEAQRIPASLVTRLLEVLRPQFDYLVIDTPAEFSEHVLSALDASDQHILLTTPDLPALKNLRLTLDMLDLLGYRRDSRAIVLNRAGSRGGLTEADVERAVAAPPAVLLPASRDVPVSVNRGVPLVTAEPGHRFSVAIRELAGWCAQHDKQPAQAPARRSVFRGPLRIRRSV